MILQSLRPQKYVIHFKYQWEYFHIDIFLQYSQLKQLYQSEYKTKNIYNSFGFLRKQKK